MYYIVNQTDHIIAADNDLLETLSVSSLYDLQKDIALGNIEFTSPVGREIRISLSGETKVYHSENHTLSSLLGDMILIELKEEENDEEKIDLVLAESDLISLKDDTEEEENDEEKIDLVLAESDLISLKDDTEEEENGIVTLDKPKEQLFESEDELPTLLEEDAPLELIPDDIPEISDTKEEDLPTASEETAPVVIDIQKISQMIGITPEDYDHFLKEYIDTALTLEDDLKGSKEKQRSQALDTLGHLSHVLHLPTVYPIIDKIREADDNTRSQYITSLYDTLSRMVIAEEAAPVGTEAVKTPTDQSFGTIDLSSVKPIHFDFQLEKAANDLSLPIELIEEFVIDFIDQAHIETEKMLEAY